LDHSEREAQRLLSERRMMKHPLCLLVASIVPIACASGSLSASAARERAEADLKCPSKQLVVDQRRGNSAEFFVHGCGRQALYVCERRVSGGGRNSDDAISCRRF
jgi:hypothetical protein